MEDFYKFLIINGWEPKQVRVTKYNVRGTNNYVIGLNHFGTEWAITLRIPAMGKDSTLFEDDKKQAIETAKYLEKILSKGVVTSKNVLFCFRGTSCLADNFSVHNFFESQSQLDSLKEIDNITNRSSEVIKSKIYPEGIRQLNLPAEEEERIINYLKMYSGAYFVSNGAPSSETLENYIELYADVLKGLVFLHKKSGLDSLLPIKEVYKIAQNFDMKLNELTHTIKFEEKSSIFKSYIKYLAKCKAEENTSMAFLIKKEILLRTIFGKEILKDLIVELDEKLDKKSSYMCFTHNDPHCDNFIVVRFLYKFLKKNHNYVDREYLNEIIDNTQLNDKKLSIAYDEFSNTLLYRNYIDGDEINSNISIVEPSINYEIHIIDIDDATGTEESTKKSYLYDLLIFALSVQNVSEIKGKKIMIKDLVELYYKFWSEN